MMPMDTSSTIAAWIASFAALIAVPISIVALVYARKEANASAASAKSAHDSADEGRRANELAERAEQRALAATEANRYRWEIVHYENEAYSLFNLGTDIAHDVTMTVNYPDEWLLDLPTDTTIGPQRSLAQDFARPRRLACLGLLIRRSVQQRSPATHTSEVRP
jgi:hypothetical protein